MGLQVQLDPEIQKMIELCLFVSQLCFSLCVSVILKQVLSKWQGKKMATDSSKTCFFTKSKREESLSLAVSVIQMSRKALIGLA